MLKIWGTTCDINQETRSLSMEQNVTRGRRRYRVRVRSRYPLRKLFDWFRRLFDV